MTAFQAVLLILLAAAGTVVVLTRTPRKQVIAMSFYGLLLSLLFLAIQAPDVALSQLAVGAVAVPLMLLVALANVRRELHK